MNFLKKIFHRRRERKPSTLSPEPLTIEGIASAPMTPEPDEAEQAAAALLASLSSGPSPKGKGKQPPTTPPSGGRGAAYYQALAHRIREGREMEERACRRWLTYCEQQLTLPSLAGEGAGERLSSLERGLYDRQDIAQRAGGDLFRRWQRCLAEVTIRLMKAPYNPPAGDNGNS